jgi:tetratricopeptide (TPR) repeat protein
MFTRQHRAAVALVVALSLGPALGPAGTGRAQAATAQEAAELKAKQAYSRGAELYKEHKFSEAAAAFTEGYGYKPHYAFLWNLALAYRALGAHDKAIDAYQRYLKSCPATATADRAAAEAAIVEERDLQARGAPAAAVADAAPTLGHAGADEARSGSGKVWRKWWFWTATGAALAAVGLGVGLGVGLSPGSTAPYREVTWQ